MKILTQIYNESGDQKYGPEFGIRGLLVQESCLESAQKKGLHVSVETRNFLFIYFFVPVVCDLGDLTNTNFPHHGKYIKNEDGNKKLSRMK
jgi:hypothetical protein